MGDVPKELEEHLCLSGWLNKHGVFYIHIPNEGQRSVQQAVMLKRMGMVAGAPDFIIPGTPNIALELKRCRIVGKKGGMVGPSKVSKEQIACLKKLNELGWKTHIAYGAAEAIGYLMNQSLTKVSLKSIPLLEKPVF